MKVQYFIMTLQIRGFKIGFITLIYMIFMDLSSLQSIKLYITQSAILLYLNSNEKVSWGRSEDLY